MLLTKDYKEAALLCQKRILEGGCAYLESCNDRYIDANVRILITFHRRICYCMNALVRELYDQIALGEISRKKAEEQISFLQSRCFEIMVPIIDITQEMTAVEDADELYDTFRWMEEMSSMKTFLAKHGGYEKAAHKLKKMLEHECDVIDLQAVVEYEKQLSV